MEDSFLESSSNIIIGGLSLRSGNRSEEDRVSFKDDSVGLDGAKLGNVNFAVDIDLANV